MNKGREGFNQFGIINNPTHSEKKINKIIEAYI